MIDKSRRAVQMLMKELLEEKSFLVNAILNSEIKKENSSKEICKTLKNDLSSLQRVLKNN